MKSPAEHSLVDSLRQNSVSSVPLWSIIFGLGLALTGVPASLNPKNDFTTEDTESTEGKDLKSWRVVGKEHHS